jgi:hypothetical protein
MFSTSPALRQRAQSKRLGNRGLLLHPSMKEKAGPSVHVAKLRESVRMLAQFISLIDICAVQVKLYEAQEFELERQVVKARSTCTTEELRGIATGTTSLSTHRPPNERTKNTTARLEKKKRRRHRKEGRKHNFFPDTQNAPGLKALSKIEPTFDLSGVEVTSGPPGESLAYHTEHVCSLPFVPLVGQESGGAGPAGQQKPPQNLFGSQSQDCCTFLCGKQPAAFRMVGPKRTKVASPSSRNVSFISCETNRLCVRGLL